MQNYQTYYPSYLQTNFQSPTRNHSPNVPNNSINVSINSNIPITMSQSPSIPLIFQVPKQKPNRSFNLNARTPSPSYQRRNFVNLNDNTKFKEKSNSNVIYRKLPGMESIKKIQNINPNIRCMSPQPVNIRVNYHKDLIPASINSPVYINFEQKVPRVARTPEQKNNHFNNIKSRNNIHKYNNSYINNDINININNITIYNENIKHSYNNPFNKYQNIETINSINNSQNVKLMSDVNNNYLKTHNNINNIMIIKPNDLNQNKNYNNIIKIKKSNNSNKNIKNIIIKDTNKFNPFYSYQNNINKQKFGINQHQFHNHIHSNFLNNIHNNSLSFTKITNTNTPNNTYYQNSRNFIKKDDSFHNNNSQNININIVSSLNKSNNYQDQNYKNDSYNNLYLSSNQNIPPNISKNHINIIPIPQNKNIFHFGEKGIIKKPFKDLLITRPIPKDDFNVKEFQILKQIGEGTFGKIYCVKWIKTNELYALKKLNLMGEELNSFRKTVKIMQNLMQKIQDNGLIKIYGDKIILQKKPNQYHYYILMELGERDWEREIIIRKTYSLYYTEYELFQIIKQLVKTLSLMEKNRVTHRDIKPQNILLCKKAFKICDFDEAKIIEEDGPTSQPVRGSELYMSPILFYAYNSQVYNVLHNTFKSDVFSLGMTFFLAAALSVEPLCDIREIKDMNIISQIINNTLNIRYSQNLINILIKMLQIDENLRCNFIELEEYISIVWPN